MKLLTTLAVALTVLAVAAGGALGQLNDLTFKQAQGDDGLVHMETPSRGAS